MTDPTARKAAEAVVKTARKAYDSAAKKAESARQKYAELQGEANRAARVLAHASTNPDLFDDDPLSVVFPAFGTAMPSGVVLDEYVAAAETVIAEIAAVTETPKQLMLPEESLTSAAAFLPPSPIAQPAPLEPTYPEAGSSEPDPWDLPAAPGVPDIEADVAPVVRRKRRTKAQIEADNAAAAAGIPIAPAAPPMGAPVQLGVNAAGQPVYAAPPVISQPF